MTSSEMRSACTVLFGPRAALDSGFLARVDVAELRRCFRVRALEMHPDRAAILGRPAGALAEEFKRVEAAHRALVAHLEAGGRLDLQAGAAPAGVHRVRSDLRHRPRPPARASAGPQPASRPMDHYWHSGLPARTLRFGEYLYYSGRISWMQLIRALVWQAGERPRFGRLAAQFGYLTPDAVTQSLTQRRPDERIGEAALRLHLMSALQHQVVLLAQTSGRRRIGDFFLESRALQPFDIEDLGRAFRQHNARVALAAAR